MKKILIIIVIALVSCNSKQLSTEQKLKVKAEKYLLKTLHNPNSYQFVGFKIDTLKRHNINTRLNDIYKLLKNTTGEGNITALNDELNATKIALSNTNEMTYKYTYRATNKFNALVLETKTVVTDKDYDLVDFY